MAWELSGQYVENCSCDAICPCTWSNLSRPATYDDCRFTLGFRIDRGTVDNIDMSGRTVVVVGQSPKMMTDGNWRVGLVFDQDATDEQMDRLTRVFTGQLGGAWGNLAPLISEVLGAERAPIDLRLNDDGWSLNVGNATQLQGTKERGPDSPDPVTLTGIVAHPSGPVLTVTPGTDVRSSLFGVEFSGTDRNGFSAPFSWAA